MAHTEHPAVVLTRALENRDAEAAWEAARNAGPIGLATVLELLLLVREQTPERYSRAATRFLARFLAEAHAVSIAEAALVSAHLAAIEHDGSRGAIEALAAQLDARSRKELSKVVRRWEPAAHAEAPTSRPGSSPRSA